MNITGKYLKVWKKETNEQGWTKLNLGDSSKNKDGTYNNFTWFGCSLVGGAKSIPVNEGDIIEIKSGIIYQEKCEGKYYNRITIFDFEVSGATTAAQQSAAQGEQFDDIPF